MANNPKQLKKTQLDLVNEQGWNLTGLKIKPMKRSSFDEEEHKLSEVTHPIFMETRNTYNPKSGLSAHMTTYSNVGHRGGLGGIK